MNENIRISRDQVRQGDVQGQAPMRNGNGNRGLIIAVVVVVVAVLAGLVLFRDRFGAGKKDGSTSTGQSSEYQAMFLSNGQVYFGKISKERGEYVKLTDIFYLQVTPVQGSQAEPKQQPTLQLVKLGNELHGPVDEMHINREHILFYEDLKEDGKVVQAIKEYKANPNRGTGSTGGSQTQQQQQQQQVVPSTTTPNRQVQPSPTGN